MSVVVSFDRPANAALVGEWGSPVDWPAPGVAIHANMLPNGQLLTWGRTVHQPAPRPLQQSPSSGILDERVRWQGKEVVRWCLLRP